MAKISTNISIDEDIKAEAQILFEELGMDLSTAVNIFLRQSVSERAIPFAICREQPNQTTLDAMYEIEKISCNPKLYKSYRDVDEMMENLLND